MINPQIINELADKLSEVLPKANNSLKQDIQKNLFEILKSAFKRMDLVSSEEFEVQKRLLANLEKKLSILEDKVIELEKE